MTDKQQLADNVFPAWKAVNLAQDYVEQTQLEAQSGFANAVRFGLKDVDEVLDPMTGGDFVPILGRPANGKTLLARHIFKNKVRQLVEQGKESQVGIWITYEVSVEREMMYWIAQDAGISVTEMKRGIIQPKEWERFNLAALKVASMPVFLVGHTTMRDHSNRRRRPYLPPDVVSQALDYIMNEYRTEENEPIEPAVMVLDYLQRMHKPPRLDRQEHYLQCVDWCKDTALWGDCPFIVPVQARREVDDREIKLPGLADGQWTSNIEQSADIAMSAWMPKTGKKDKTPSFAGLPEIPVTDNLMLFGILKQKDAPAPKVYPLHVEPQYLKVEMMDPYREPLY